MKNETEQMKSMMNKSDNICPYFKKVENHGRCHAYPDGLMNPSLDEMVHLCLTEKHGDCLYYQLLEKENKPDENMQHVTAEKGLIHGEICERTEEVPLLL